MSTWCYEGMNGRSSNHPEQPRWTLPPGRDSSFLGAFFFKSAETLLSALEFQSIMNTRGEALGVIGYELVPKLARSKAEGTIRVIWCGSNPLKGGTHYILGALLICVCHKGGYVRPRRPDATLYIADIGPRAIVGYPLMARHGLAIVPGEGTLLFEEDLGEEVMSSPPLVEPPLGFALTQVEKDNQNEAVVPFYCLQDASITEDSHSRKHRDQGSATSVGVGTGMLNALVESHTQLSVPYEGVHSYT